MVEAGIKWSEPFNAWTVIFQHYRDHENITEMTELSLETWIAYCGDVLPEGIRDDSKTTIFFDNMVDAGKAAMKLQEDYNTKVK